MSFVYVAGAFYTPTDAQLPCLKVGFSDDPERRQSDLGTHLPIQVRILAAADVGSRTDARRVERAIHALLRGDLIKSEWFHFEDVESAVVRITDALEALATPGIIAWELSPRSNHTNKVTDNLMVALAAVDIEEQQA